MGNIISWAVSRLVEVALGTAAIVAWYHTTSTQLPWPNIADSIVFAFGMCLAFEILSLYAFTTLAYPFLFHAKSIRAYLLGLVVLYCGHFLVFAALTWPLVPETAFELFTIGLFLSLIANAIGYRFRFLSPGAADLSPG
jgi:hypothetical protein